MSFVCCMGKTTNNKLEINEFSEDPSLQMFIKGFSEKDKFPFIVDKDLFDSSRVIPNELVDKYIKGNSTRYYYGTRFHVRDSIYGFVYHFFYKFVSESYMHSDLQYIGSNVLYLSSKGHILNKLYSVYYKQEGNDDYGDFFMRDNQSTIERDGTIVKSKSEKYGQLKDAVWYDYEEVVTLTLYSWDETNNLVKGESKIVEHNTDKINPEARKAVLKVLKDIKDIKFVAIKKENQIYYRFKPECRESEHEFKILETSKEPTTSGIGSIYNDRYFPIWINEVDEYSAQTILEASFDQSSEKYHLVLKSLEVIKADKGVVDLEAKGMEINIIRSEDGFLMFKLFEDDSYIYANQEFATTLPFSDSSCNSDIDYENQ
jgi:hypothetical protein